MQRITKLVERERLHVVLHIRPRHARVRTREHPQLRWRHAHRPAAVERVLHADQRLAPPVGGARVERRHAMYLHHAAQLQMVLQVLAHTGQRLTHVDAQRLQSLRLTDARQLQQLRRVDRPSREDHLFTRGHRVVLPCPAIRHARTALAVKRERAHLRTGHDGQIGPLRCRTQKTLGRVPTDAVFLVDLEVADTEVVPTVEVARARDAGLHGGFDEGLQHLPLQALRFDAPFAAGAVPFVGTAVVVLAGLEERQHGIPLPRRIAGGGSPAVVVLALAAHVDHAVDRRAAAQYAAARVAE